MLINNDTYQRETVSERSIRQPLIVQVPQLSLSKIKPRYLKHSYEYKFKLNVVLYNNRYTYDAYIRGP